MTLLPSSSTHRTLSLSLSPSHQRPRYSVLAAAFPPLPFQLPSHPPRSRAPPTSNSAFHSLRSPFETGSFSLSLSMFLSRSLSPSPLFLFRSALAQRPLSFPLLPLPHRPHIYPILGRFSSFSFLREHSPSRFPPRPEGFPQNLCRDNHRRLTTDRRIVDRIVGRDKPPPRIPRIRL